MGDDLDNFDENIEINDERSELSITERRDGEFDGSITGREEVDEVDESATGGIEEETDATERREEEISQSGTERRDEEIDQSEIGDGEVDIDESATEKRGEEIDESNTGGTEDGIEVSTTERKDEEIDESTTIRREDEIDESSTEKKAGEIDESTIERGEDETNESITGRQEEETEESVTERGGEEFDESATERKDEEVDESTIERREEETEQSATERGEGEIGESTTGRRGEETEESTTERQEEESTLESETKVNTSTDTRTNHISERLEKVKEGSRNSSAKSKTVEIHEYDNNITTEAADVSNRTETDVLIPVETINGYKEINETIEMQTESHSEATANLMIAHGNQKELNSASKGVSASFDEQEYIESTESYKKKLPEITPQKQTCDISNFFTVHIQLDDGTVKNQIVTIVRTKGRKPFLGGYRHKLSGIEYHNASIQTRPRPRPPPNVELFSRDTQTFQVRHQKINTTSTTSTQMTMPGVFVSNHTDHLIVPGKYETADDYKDRLLGNIIIIQKYYRRWLAKNIVENRRQERDERLAWEKHEKDMKSKEKAERIKREYERRMHPKTLADFDLLYNGLERWRQDQLVEINNGNSSEAEKKAAKLLLLDEETDLLAAIDRHKIDRNQQSKSEEVQRLLNKAAAPKSWKDTKGRKVEMDTPYTIRSRELLDILNSLNMQYLTPDERLDVLLTLKHTVKEHDCKLTRDIIDLVDREADLIMRSVKDNSLVGLRKRIVTLFLQYCKTPTFNPEISLLLKVPQDPSVLIGDINYCKYCGRYLHSTEFSLSTKSAKLTICKSCARKENQSRKRQDYSHYRRILKDLQMTEQQIEDGSKIAFIFKQNDIKTLMESVWDNKSILSECEDLDELIFVRWDRNEHWSPWNTVLLTKDESEAHEKVVDLSATYSNVMLNRIHHKHVIAKNMFASLEKMIDKANQNAPKATGKV